MQPAQYTQACCIEVVFGGNLSSVRSIAQKLVGWLVLPVLCKEQSAEVMLFE